MKKIFKTIEAICDVIYHIGFVVCVFTIPIRDIIIPIFTPDIQRIANTIIIWFWLITFGAFCIAGFRDVFGISDTCGEE